jgi:hypothetical protein
MNTPTNLARHPQTNQSSIRTAINKRIRLGTTSASDQKRAVILSLFAIGPILAWIFMGPAVRACNDSLVMEITNLSSIEQSIQCLIFNNECHCHIPPNETLFLDRCLPRLELFAMRIIPVVSFVLQLFAFREYVTLGTDNSRFSTTVAGVMFPVVSIGIAIAMYSTHCYHLHLGNLVFVTSGLLAMLVFHDCTENTMAGENERQRRNANRLAPPIASPDKNAPTWNEIL